jgi:hypothetical protein
MSIVSPVRFRRSSAGSLRRGLHRAIVGALLFGVVHGAHALTMEVAWTDPKCDFIVTKNEAGHGIAMRMTPMDLVAGDQLDGALDQIGFIRKIAKVGTEESLMMQIRKYGIRRQVAFDFIYDWSRYCNPPEK